MKVLVILNGISSKKELFYQKYLPALKRIATVTVVETERPGHAEILARNAAFENTDVVLAVGGDGTLSQVVNGLLKNTSPALPSLALVPLGSGNDFARTINVKADKDELVRLLRANQPKQVDVGEALLRTENGEVTQRYFLNVCSIGMGPEVVTRMENNKSALGASATYLQAIVSTFLSLQAKPIDVKTDNWNWSGKARVCAIANGTSFGHSVIIAPDASIHDGRFHTFIAGDFPLWRFLLYLTRIKKGVKVKDPQIVYHEASTVTVTTPQPVPVEAEGELIGFTPLECRVAIKKMPFLY